MTLDAVMAELRAMRAEGKAEFRALRREVRQLAQQRGQDVRLGPFLAACYRFDRGNVWTAAGLLERVRYARREELQQVLDQIIGDRGDAAIKLGRWLQKHIGCDAEGYRLERPKRECGSWLYAVVESKEWPL